MTQRGTKRGSKPRRMSSDAANEPVAKVTTRVHSVSENPTGPTREHSQNEKMVIPRDERGRMLPGGPQVWKPGQSGNPAGRPALEREITREARALSQDALMQLADVMRDRKAQAIARVRAVEIIFERAYGKAPQKIILDGDTAGMANPALAAFIRVQMEDMARTIEGSAEDVTDES